MKLWVFSDLQRDANREYGFYNPEPVDADVCVVAGDIQPNLVTSIAALSKISFRMPVIYVPGNRDYYGSDIEGLTELGRAAARAPQGKGIHLLQDDAVVIGDTRFIGATLWTDLELDGSSVAKSIGRRLADFQFINAWSPGKQVEAHKRSRAFIEAELAKPFEGATVVVSHHSPHPGSISERFRDNREGLNAAFHSDLSEIMHGPDAPDLWVHGAVHSNFDYSVGRTRVLCNSRGYEEFIVENPQFDPALVVETSVSLQPTP